MRTPARFTIADTDRETDLTPLRPLEATAIMPEEVVNL